MIYDRKVKATFFPVTKGKKMPRKECILKVNENASHH